MERTKKSCSIYNPTGISGIFFVNGKRPLFHIRLFVLDLFEHGEREVVEKVFLVCFPLIFLMKNQVSSLNEKGVKAALTSIHILQPVL